MATTPGGTYYAASTEALSDWPATSENLALQLESRLAAKAALASPALTGTPTAPTAANGTNSTQIATTEFVLANAPSPGLTLITTQAFSGASAVNVNNCFSSTYDHYRVVLTVTGSADSINVNLRMRASASDNAAASYGFQELFAGATTLAGGRTVGQTSIKAAIAQSDTNYFSIDVYSPARAVATYFRTVSSYVTDQGMSYPSVLDIAGQHNVATAYDGFSLIPSAGTITGSLSVYGYKK